MNEDEIIKILANTLESVCKSFSSYKKTILICFTIFACVWWVTYMCTPYLTRNYINESNNIRIEGSE